MGDGTMQPQRMETAFLSVGNQPFVVFQSTGDQCLAMPFQHRQIDHEIHLYRGIADPDIHACRIAAFPGIGLHVLKRHAVLSGNPFVAGCPEGIPGIVSHPGSFHDYKIVKTALLQVCNHALQNLRMGCRSLAWIPGHYQIRLQADSLVPVPDQLRQARTLQNADGHIFIIRTVND